MTGCDIGVCVCVYNGYGCDNDPIMKIFRNLDAYDHDDDYEEDYGGLYI